MGCPPPCEPPALAPIEQALARGDPEAARAALLTLLAARGEAGDGLAAVTLRVLAQSRFAPDAMALAMERLLALVRAQEGQIRALRAMVETGL